MLYILKSTIIRYYHYKLTLLLQNQLIQFKVFYLYNMHQVQTQSYQLPQYESTLLKKQKQSRHLSPKVTQMQPQIKQVYPFKIKKHHLDDSQMKLALHYDYDDCHQPRQYVFKGDRLQYQKNDPNVRNNPNKSPKFNNTFQKTEPNKQLKLHSQYYQSHTNFHAPQFNDKKDTSNNHSKQNIKKSYQSQNPQPNRLKKSVSVSDFQTLRKNQDEIAYKMETKLNQLENQNDKIKLLIKNKQKSSQQQPLTVRYESENKTLSVEKDLLKLKDKLQKQRVKEKQRLANELRKIKEQGKKIKQQQKHRKKSFKQLIQKQKQRTNSQNPLHQNQSPNRYMDNLIITSGTIPYPSSLRLITQTQTNSTYKLNQQASNAIQDKIIRDKLTQLETKYLPKINIVNKRIQCELINGRDDKVQRIRSKPQFVYNGDSETDSEFSDY